MRRALHQASRIINPVLVIQPSSSSRFLWFAPHATAATIKMWFVRESGDIAVTCLMLSWNRKFVLVTWVHLGLNRDSSTALWLQHPRCIHPSIHPSTLVSDEKHFAFSASRGQRVQCLLGHRQLLRCKTEPLFPYFRHFNLFLIRELLDRSRLFCVTRTEYKFCFQIDAFLNDFGAEAICVSSLLGCDTNPRWKRH